LVFAPDREAHQAMPLIADANQIAGVMTMRKIWLCSVGLVALGMAAPALAADLPAYTKAPVMIPALYDWSGWYVGINGGWGTENRCFDFTTPAGAFIASEGCHNASGGVAGGQLGYRWEMNSWVFGVEAQGDWAGLSGSNASTSFPGDVNRSRMDAFGLFTGQIGYAWNTTLVYVKGGAAVVADRNDILFGGTVVATAPGDNRWGGTVGAGVEYSFYPNWSVAVEYDHIFIGNNLSTFTTPAGTFFGTDRIRGDAEIIMARINYRFGGPVIPKY
jgi:outer membrane immunogenic protein